MNAALVSFVAGLAALQSIAAEQVLFQDDFHGRLAGGWSWIREEPSAWRVRDDALELRILPGNLWGGGNNSKNILVRLAPETTPGELEVAVTVRNNPTEQWEQVGLAWYYDDSHMVKLVRERVDGLIRVVMGREQADRTRTLGLITVETPSVRLRLLVSGNQVRGEYLPEGSKEWLEAGRGDLPAPAGGVAKVALHSYNGPANAEHWARLTEFRILRHDRQR
jgi:regulation of enolase protein 1 (concanavalin A-like superfamily)